MSPIYTRVLNEGEFRSRLRGYNVRILTTQAAGMAGIAALAALCLSCTQRRMTPRYPCLISAATAHTRLQIFDRPFAGEHAVSNMFDHDLPILHADRNDYQLTACGRRVNAQPRGHYGYDWPMPVGTPLLAVADGRIIRAEQEPPVTCLGRRRTGALVVVIETKPNDTDVIRAAYGHLDRIDVTAGDTVHAGHVIGTSGNSGCSRAPHLHFQAARVFDRGEVLIDPYGWHSQDADPWTLDSRGAASLWLWRSGEAPQLFR